MTTQHLNKVIAGTLAAMLTCALVPAQALSPIDLSTPKAYADEVSQTRTDIVKATYLVRRHLLPQRERSDHARRVEGPGCCGLLPVGWLRPGRRHPAQPDGSC